ncbi:aldo/keto reductase [Vulcanococcus limneticus Candia 3F8]|uniref:aldo/keto reductase n=1 Tax=Vulcanococcus limneticus TaxID=2170428 RepID=UPI000B98C03F|nr:aldo/keto reductase [Vulcanococcus limneticus]MCP9790246.1 aldo/keto reductase [Vulcanococcus limneticus MW73D5]MCP9894668.1 aldo/keto reductase [Vulcanococcus limneticus Candia 3F8]MCP9895645.1 aldo/keto reductase [Vulcanococcus limneticus Candia 3B3]
MASPVPPGAGPGPLPTRRFGRTELAMPVLSLGGMRFQQSWSDLPADQITAESQANLRATLERAVAHGFHHVETARHYGSSERQLGWLLPQCPDPGRILQTKVPPQDDAAAFEAELALSFERLGVERVDLLGIHGLNLPEHLEQTLRPGGCMDVARRWQAEGRIGSVGFSTHAPLSLMLEAIASDRFDYINLHWYYIRQDNGPAIVAATARDMGVFVISPTDKGGHLHSPSPRLLELCAPLHPIVFNDLFCLSAPGIHTLSVGAARPEDLELHLQAVALLPRAAELLPPIVARLEQARREVLGEAWLSSWERGLPEWQDTPGQINLPVLLWLHNLLEAWDLQSFGRARYGLLGSGGHWFPGANADALDVSVSEVELLGVLGGSPWAAQIPDLLRRLRERIGGEQVRRLQQG